MSSDILSISCARGVRTFGDTLSGVVNFKVTLAEQNDITGVTISLRGKIVTKIRTSNGNSSTTHRQVVQLVKQVQPLWTPGTYVPSDASGIAHLPFALTLPSGGLPPSFHLEGPREGGMVQYYLHAKASRKSWYQIAVRVNFPFAFLPTSPANITPPALLSGWTGPWTSINFNKEIRKGLFSAYGSVHAEVQIPSLSVIPLFVPIPIQIKIRCTSKPLPTDDVSKFEFPRRPGIPDMNLRIRQQCQVRVFRRQRACRSVADSMAGFGRRPVASLGGAHRGQVVQADVGQPQWQPGLNDEKGRWSEEVTYASALTFRCPPPFTSETLDSFVFLDLKIQFPGIGNNVESSIGPLRLGASSMQAMSNPPTDKTALPAAGQASVQEPNIPPAFNTLDLPPSYWDVVDHDEKD